MKMKELPPMLEILQEGDAAVRTYQEVLSIHNTIIKLFLQFLSFFVWIISLQCVPMKKPNFYTFLRDSNPQIHP